MEKTLKIDYKMEGNINGVDITHIGQGFADFENGIEEVNIRLSSIPDGWHPFLLPCICSGPSRVGVIQGPLIGGKSPSLFSLSDWHYYTEPGKLRLGELYNLEGELLGKVAATGDYKRVDDKLVYRIQMRSTMELPMPVMGISHYSYVLLPNGKGKVIAQTHFRVETVTGETLHGFTTIPYGYPTDSELDHVVMGVQFIETEVDGLDFRYRTETIRRFAPIENKEYKEYFAFLKRRD